MSFHYFMKPNPASPAHPFTTRPDLQPAMSEAQFLAAVAALGTGRTPESVGTLIDDIFTVLRQAARDTRSVEAVRAHFRTLPTSGGTFDSPDGTVTAHSAGVNYSLILTRDEIVSIQAGLAMESSGLLGGRTPQVDTEATLPQGEVNAWRVQGGIEVRGLNLRDGQNGPLPVVRLIDPTGTANPVTLSVLDCTEKRILLAIPTLTQSASDRQLQVTATLNGHPLTAIYGPLIRFLE